MKSAIVVRNLTKEYGERKAVDNVSFAVPKGIVCGFVGPNGSGKTTTIRALLSLIKPTSGEIEILGCDISSSSSYLKVVGSMIEGPAFYPNLSGLANLKVLATLGGIDQKRSTELIEMVGLSERGHSKFKNYSLGMKQRLGIAAALLPNPELLILDEPTNGLDPNGILEIRNLIASLAKVGKTIFISSHLLNELEAICENIVLIKEGKILHDGKTERLVGNSGSGNLAISPEYEVDLTRLTKILKSLGYEFSIKSGKVHIVASTLQGADINRVAFESGITLRLISDSASSLEEKFFELVQK